MKLKPEFITHTTPTESVLVPAGGSAFSGLVRGNKTLGAILTLLQEETTEEQLVAAMRARFDAPAGVIEADVQKALEQLRGIGALHE